MAITTTLAKMKNYFETWHIKEYDRLHTTYNDSDLRSLIQRIQNALPKDQYGNLTSIYSNTEIDNFISTVNSSITNVQNSLSNYYKKSEIDTKVNALNASISNKLDKNPSNGGWVAKRDWTSYDASNISIFINETIHMGSVRMAMPFDSAVKGKAYTWTSYMTIPSAYRPTSYYNGACQIEAGDTAGGGGTLWVDSNGKIGGRFDIGWSNGDSRTVRGSIWWRW